ncbi:CRISPR-associated protein Cas2 [Ruminococcus sp. YE282]|nr:CRISPR-associated protein Cas2 [Ruminococcus bromii]
MKFGGKMYVILVYDIVTDDEGKKILPKVFKTCKKYLTHIQNSVFEGNLSKPNSVALKKELEHYIRKDTDSVITFHTREERWMSKDFWGKFEDKTSNFI